MRQRPRATIHELRLAIECLPHATRVAMLEGIETNQIIAGAYSDANGICPMLAAHRAGGRTGSISFARAWDGFAFRDSRASRARRATERELLVLRSHLEASLLEDDVPAADLVAAAQEHRRLLARRDQRTITRVIRRYDDYDRMLARLTVDGDDGPLERLDREPAPVP